MYAHTHIDVGFKTHTDRSPGHFAKFRKTTISCVMSVRPSGTTLSLLEGFSWNLIFEIFFLEKSVEKIQVPLKSDKNNSWYFTWIPTDVCDRILVLRRVRNGSDEICRENKRHTFCVQYRTSSKSCRLWQIRKIRCSQTKHRWRCNTAQYKREPCWMFLGFRSRDLNKEGCCIGEQSTLRSTCRQPVEGFSYNFVLPTFPSCAGFVWFRPITWDHVTLRPYLDFSSKIFLKIPNSIFISFATNGVSCPLHIGVLSHAGSAWGRAFCEWPLKFWCSRYKEIEYYLI